MADVCRNHYALMTQSSGGDKDILHSDSPACRFESGKEVTGNRHLRKIQWQNTEPLAKLYLRS
jgi:hypothetical protein